MKKITFSVLLLIALGTLSSNAQQAVLPAGGEATGSGGNASYSVGQVFYTAKGSSETITDGVQQPYEFYISVDLIKSISLSMSVFPNPTDAIVNLLVEDLDVQELSFQLFDATGRFITTKQITDSMTEVPMQQLASGAYFLKVLYQKETVKSFTIIKN